MLLDHTAEDQLEQSLHQCRVEPMPGRQEGSSTKLFPLSIWINRIEIVLCLKMPDFPGYTKPLNKILGDLPVQSFDF